MEVKEKIKKLVIFDMDGTLIKNPDKEECERVWLEKFNKPWPYNGVYSKPESLDFTIFEIPLIPHIIDEYNKVKDDELTHRILLTGRLIKLKNEVVSLLHHKKLFFDQYLLNNKGDTKHFKLFEMFRLYKEYPNVEEILFFDDRYEHIIDFIEMGVYIEKEALKVGRKVKVIVTHVKDPLK